MTARWDCEPANDTAPEPADPEVVCFATGDVERCHVDEPASLCDAIGNPLAKNVSPGHEAGDVEPPVRIRLHEDMTDEQGLSLDRGRSSVGA